MEANSDYGGEGEVWNLSGVEPPMDFLNLTSWLPLPYRRGLKHQALLDSKNLAAPKGKAMGP